MTMRKGLGERQAFSDESSRDENIHQIKHRGTNNILKETDNVWREPRFRLPKSIIVNTIHTVNKS